MVLCDLLSNLNPFTIRPQCLAFRLLFRLQAALSRSGSISVHRDMAGEDDLSLLPNEWNIETAPQVRRSIYDAQPFAQEQAD